MNQKTWVPARYIAPQAQHWLSDIASSRLLHLFPHAANFVNNHGAVLSLVTSDIGPNPLAIVLPPLSLPDFLTAAATPALAGTRLSVGQLIIDLATAVLWQPLPAWHNPLDLALIHRLVSQHPDFQTAVPPHLASQMQQALHNHDHTLIAQTARQLAGLGPGLTPAGDDFLVGVIYGIFRNRSMIFGNSMDGNGSPVTDYCSLITAAAAPHTTTLSANLLQVARRGEASQAWHDLMAINQTADILETLTLYDEPIGRILRTGHSSGSDALFGFLGAQTAPQL